MSDLTLRLSADQALVLLSWFAGQHQEDEPKRHPGTQQGLWNLQAVLEAVVTESFSADHQERLEDARARLLGSPGAPGRAEHVADVDVVLTLEESIVVHHWLTAEVADEALDIDPASGVALRSLQDLLAEELASILATDAPEVVAGARESLDWHDL